MSTVAWVFAAAGSILLLSLAGSAIRSRVHAARTESPSRIVGASVVLSELEGLGATPPERIEATVHQFLEDGSYRLVFTVPQVVCGRSEGSAVVSARHVGYPVSMAGTRRLLAVAGELQSGAPFIALIHRLAEKHA